MSKRFKYPTPLYNFWRNGTMKNLEETVVQILKELKMTETQAKIYVYLCRAGEATAEQIAEGTKIYPTAVREALVEMYNMGVIKRKKKGGIGLLGRRPYIYSAVPPLELVKKLASELQQKLSKLLMLQFPKKMELKPPLLPVKITIESMEKESQEEKEGK